MPLRGERRSRIRRVLAQSSRAIFISSPLTGAPSLTKPAAASTSEEANRSSIRLPDHHVLVERDRPALLDDRRRLAADGLQPLAELLGVADRRTQADHGHRLREVDHDLLPHRAAGAVGEVVHLVHHHEAEAHEGPAAGVEHVAEHLGGHHDHRRLAVDDVVAGQQPDLVGAVAVDEVVVLLVAQRLDRRRVEALAAGREGQVDGELPHHGLAGARGRSDQHAAPVLDLLAGAELEVVEREVVEGAEVVDHGMVLVLHVRRVPLRRGQLVGAHSPHYGTRSSALGVDGQRPGGALHGERQVAEPLAVGVRRDARRGHGDACGPGGARTAGGWRGCP